VINGTPALILDGRRIKGVQNIRKEIENPS
jgi:hypothetical protein